LILRRAAAALGLVLVGCSPGTSRVVPSPQPQAPPPAVRPVEVLRHGVTGGLLSVEIANPNDGVGLLRTGFTLRAYSATGTLLGRGGAGRVGDRCCTIFVLPPRGTHGLYVELGPYAARVARVEVEPRSPVWVPWPPRDEPAVVASLAHLTATSPAVVSVTVRRTAGAVADASVQAFLEDADGRLVAVVSALVRCVPSTGRTVPLELFRPVPAGTRVGRVVAYAVPRRAGGCGT
jgi:hypothetical protein